MRKLSRASSSLKYRLFRIPFGIWSTKQKMQLLAQERARSMR